MYGLVALAWLLGIFNPVRGVGVDECYGVACVDLNRDSLSDVVVASESGIYYYKNEKNEGGDFSLRKLTSIPARSVGVGRLRGTEQNLDVFVATPDRDFLLINTGDDLNFDVDSSDFASGQSRGASLADFDTDGDLDILVAGDTTRLYSNLADTGFTQVTTFPSGYALACADYNSDRSPDFALCTDGGILLYTGPDFALDTSIAATNPRGLCWFDANTDGLLDLAVADSAAPNLLLTQTGTGFSSRQMDTLNAPSLSVAAGHFWGQPGVDLLFINYGGYDHLYQGSPAGIYSSHPDDSITFENNNKGRAVALAQIDGEDGIDAMVVGSNTGPLYQSDVTTEARLEVHLKGRRDKLEDLSNTVAAGARLELFENGELAEFWEIGSAGFQDAPEKVLPLPTVTGYLLRITWPRSGVVDSVPLDTFTSSLPLEVYAYEDITPPSTPGNLICTSHDTLQWWNQREVHLEWEASQDPHGSGLAGYSVAWDTFPDALPDAVPDVSDTATSGVFESSCQDSTCYFIISSVDRVGNLSLPAHKGPFKLDFAPPVGIVGIQPADGSYVDTQRIEYRWTKGEDELSGIKNYYGEVSKDPYFFGENVYEFTAPADSGSHQALEPLDEDTYYWRIIAVDIAGNSDTVPKDTLPGISFKIDIQNPWVRIRDVRPRGQDPPAPLNPTIYIPFNERMLPDSALLSRKYTVEQNSKQFSVTADFFSQNDSTIFILRLDTLLEPDTRVWVSVSRSLTDLAGNQIHPDSAVTWDFLTGEYPDTVQPVIDSVTFTPNPTFGEDSVKINAWVSDTAVGSLGPRECIYYINENQGPYYTKIADGVPDSTHEVFTNEISVSGLGLDNGNQIFSFQARDLAEPPNWSEKLIDTLLVRPDTNPPQISVNILNDTLEEPLQVGDTLNLEINSSQALKNLSIIFYQNSTQIYDTLFFPSPPEPVLPSSLEADIHLKGFPPGLVKGTVTGVQDSAQAPGNAFFEFSLKASELLNKEKVFAAPNPAAQEVVLYFTPGEEVTATATVFTIDGKPVWESQEVTAEGGVRNDNLVISVSDWPVGLYVMVVEAVNTQGRKARVKKVFAVVR